MFRDEAIANVSVRRYGQVLLARPISYSVLTGIFVLIALSIILFLLFFNYSRKIQVVGVLLPESGLIRVSASQVGTIVQRLVSEGQRVKVGEPLFVLTSERTSAAKGETEKMISSLIRDRRESLLADRGQMRLQADQRIESLARRGADLTREIDRISSQIALQQRRVAIAEESLQRFSDLERQNFVSSAQSQDKQAELIDQRLRLAELEGNKSTTVRDLSATQSDLQNLRIQANRDQEGASRSIATLDQDITESEARRQILIRATQDGAISGVVAEPGQSVLANQFLASLVPKDASLIAELYAPSKAAGFIKSGMEVLVRYQAYPYQKFGQHRGRVMDVSAVPIRAEEIGLSGAFSSHGGSAEPFYRVRVSLDKQTVTTYGHQQALKPGMALDASILLERRRLYEWVLEPVYTITGRM